MPPASSTCSSRIKLRSFLYGNTAGGPIRDPDTLFAGPVDQSSTLKVTLTCPAGETGCWNSCGGQPPHGPA
jgi:hypothetical protein